MMRGAVIPLQTLGGMLIERVDNGWIIRDASIAKMNMGMDPAPVRVAETPEALGNLVAEWAEAQHDAMMRRAGEALSGS